jgi:hypothetical protein
MSGSSTVVKLRLDDIRFADAMRLLVELMRPIKEKSV